VRNRVGRVNIFICLMIFIVLLQAIPLAGGEPIVERLEQLCSEYTAIKVNPTVKLLFDFDNELRNFVCEFHEHQRVNDGKICNPQGDLFYWQDKYDEIGLSIHNYFLTIEYSGIFLARAHKLDPHSPWREYTLYSTILRGEDSYRSGKMPDIEAAFRYELEFPCGPFIAETLDIISGFFTDLYMVLRDQVPDEPTEDWAYLEYWCYKPYITCRPLAEQRMEAQEKAIAYLRKYLVLRPDDTYTAQALEQVIDGSINVWRFCSN
jgi:hypothetical protein